jgi:cysteine dioxygenase
MVGAALTLFERLDHYHDRIPLDVLARELSLLKLSLDEIRPYARFGVDRYQRNLLHAGPAYQALVICWRPGQRSPIHDHKGSSCAVRILEGVATETVFERTLDGLIYATSSHDLRAGDSCATQDADIHQMSNLQGKGRDLITLHIYSPPLLRMGTYSLTDAEIHEEDDPIFEFSLGSGI